jgi:hypothetical protein
MKDRSPWNKRRLKDMPMLIKKRYIFFFLLIALALVTVIQRAGSITTSGYIIANYATLYAGLGGSYSVKSNTVNTTVVTIHGLDLNANSRQTLLPGQTAYFSKILTNIGNITENVSINVSEATAGWSVQLLEDSNRDGVHQTGELTPVPSSLALPPTRDYRFFVALSSPPTLNVVGTASVTVSGSAVTLGQYQGNNLLFYGGPMQVAETNTASTTVTPSAGGPVVADLMFDGVLMVNKDYIGRTPLITAKILDPDGINTASITISIDGVATSAGITFDGQKMSFKVTASLGVGSHTFIISAKDLLDNPGTKEVTGRITDKVSIVGEVLPYPNPYNPTEGDLKICYQLTHASGIRIYLMNIVAERIWKASISEGEEGGHEGYNEVIWNGQDGFNDMIANGVYIAHITTDKGKLLGKVKILVIR